MPCRRTPRFATDVEHGDVPDASMRERTYPRSIGAGVVAPKTHLEAEAPTHTAAVSAAAVANVLTVVQMFATQAHVRPAPSPSLSNASVVLKPFQCDAHKPRPRRLGFHLSTSAAHRAETLAAKSSIAAYTLAKKHVIRAIANPALCRWKHAATAANTPRPCAAATANLAIALTIAALQASKATSHAKISASVPLIVACISAPNPAMLETLLAPSVPRRPSSSRRVHAALNLSHHAPPARIPSQPAVTSARRCPSADIPVRLPAISDRARHVKFPSPRHAGVARPSRAALATSVSKKNSKDAKRFCALPCANRCDTAASTNATASAAHSTSKQRASPRSDRRSPSCKPWTLLGYTNVPSRVPSLWLAGCTNVP